MPTIASNECPYGVSGGADGSMGLFCMVRWFSADWVDVLVGLRRKVFCDTKPRYE